MSGQAECTARVSVERIRPHGVPVIVVRGEVGTPTFDSIRAEVHEALELNPSGVVLDLTEVTFLSSDGINVLAGSCRAAAMRGTKVVIVADQSVVLRPLKITDVVRVCHVYPNLPCALSAV